MSSNTSDAIPGELIYYAYTFDPEWSDVHIVPISDVHYGNPMFSKKHFLRTIKYLEVTHNAYGILNGDLCESTIKSSKGDIFRQVGTPQNQRDWMIDILRPIRHKLLLIVSGNHEGRIYREAGVDISADIGKALGIPYRPEGCMLKLSFSKGNSWHPESPFVFWGYNTHGYGGARTKSAKAVKVERTGTYIDADFYIMSHDHVVNAAPDISLRPDNRTHDVKLYAGEPTERNIKQGRVAAKRKMLVKSNAYLYWGGYAETGGFGPSDLETPLITLTSEGSPIDKAVGHKHPRVLVTL
jgi:hypothetical protein